MPCEGDTASGSDSPKPSECRSDTKEKAMDETADAEHVKALRDSWKFPAVVHFCRVFEDPLKLRQFSSEKLENALVRPEEHTVFLSEFVYKLMTVDRRQQFSPETATEKWHAMLNDKMKRSWTHHTFLPNPLQGKGFQDISPTTRLEVLYFLTEKLLKESGTIKEVIKNTVDDNHLTADTLRSSPIGEDSRGCKYYMFAGRWEDCRLYREEFPRKKASRKTKAVEDVVEPVWSTFCTTIEDISQFVDTLSPSRSSVERQLNRVLSNTILPELIRTEKARKKAEEKAAALEAAPRKRSSRIQELTKRKEEEEELQRRNEGDFRGDGAGVDEMGGAREGEVGTRSRQDNDSHLLSHLEVRRVSMGPSREERMRLRNERKEKQERGEPIFENGLVGAKRTRYHTFGWNPLGPDILCSKRKRVQRTKAPKDCRKFEEAMMEEFGRADNLKVEFDRLIADPKEHRRLMSLAGPAPYKQTLASRRQAPQVRLQSPQQGLLFQQQMLLMRQRQMYQQRQQQRQHHPHHHHQQQQHHQQRFLAQGAPHHPHHPMTSPSHPINSSPVASQVFQQQLQQCFNRLPEAQRQAIMGMQSAQRNQVLSQLLRKEMQRAQHQQAQHHQAQQHHVQHLQNVAALRGVSGGLGTTPPEAIVRGPEDAAMLQQLHQRQAMANDSRLQLGYLTPASQMGMKQEGGVGVSGRMVPQQVGGMSMNMVALQSPVRQLSSMPQRVGPPAGYVLSGGSVNSEPTNTTPSPSPSQSIPGVHSNGSMPMRQAHPSQLLRIPGGSSQSLVGMLVPVSTAGARTAPQSNGNGSGGGGGSQQSGHRIVNV